ncbi:MAG: type I DNA topoisomerase [Verrucomicrobiota bacterium]|nr:type I DNA topoisomerase [Verrucomicrobiota bacterium]
MGKALVIVESPTKIKTLRKFLGSEYTFESSLGHIRDLPQREFGIDIEHDFEPTYVTLPDKADVIKRLQEAAKKADIVYLSPDPDREGEAIAWHISSILPKNTKIKRVAFQSITKTAVQESLKHPRDIDIDLVHAQQARRLLDRMVGYKISPILTRKVKRGHNGSSAGRVQSVALKLVVDREKEIQAFKPVEYWTIETQLESPSKERPFTAYLYAVDNLKVEKEQINEKPCFLISNQKTADSLTARLRKAKYHVESVEKKEKKRNPVPPFITSTLQQEASRHYGFSVSRTMSIAQDLYEGIDMKHLGAEGLITYMRTDSVNIAPEAISAARAYIQQRFGQQYLPEQPRLYASKKTAQEAHEAIRPTDPTRDPELVRPYLTADQYKLYLLIWRRFVASQMTSAVYDTVSADISTDQDLSLRATGSMLKFNGYLAAYEEKKDKTHAEPEEEENTKLLPPLEPNMPLSLLDILATQSFTKPPPRFTEASLVKELERLGIGRPSTYAAIMNKIQSRDYTTKESQALKPTELGQVICQMLEENFPPIMDVTFTAQMEDQLEEVAEHRKDWKELIRHFWKDFIPLVEKAEKEASVPKIDTDRICPKCNHHLQKIWSRSKYFYGCSNYPTCDFTSPLEALDFNKDDYDPNFDYSQTCPICQSSMNLRHGRFGPFLGCSRYPECKGIINIAKKGEKSYRPEDLPPCPAVGCDGRISARKSRFGKTFFSCSNYPDCDIIANSLEELSTKYIDHPKTPYAKKPKAGKGTAAKGAKAKRTSTQPSYTLSPELSALLKVSTSTRPEATKLIWDYIKANHLQDPKNKRLINPDAPLSKILGKNPIDMFKISSLLSKHLKKP